MSTDVLAFKVTAPGKVILHGEHSVVYGKPAVAGAVGARNFLYFHECSADSVQLDFVGIKVHYEFTLGEINDVLRKYRENKSDLNTPEEIQNLFIPLIPSDIADQGQKGLLSTLYLLCGTLCDYQVSSIEKGLIIQVASELRVGAGLGSSASFAVCLATAFLIYARQRVSGRITYDLSTEDKHAASKWAFESEKIMHGTPSGVDNTVCTFGSLVKFTKTLPIEHIDAKHPINILLVDSKVSRSTIKLVEKVAKIKEEFPTILEPMLDAMAQISNEAAHIYASDDSGSFEKIQKLFQINNDLLKGIGVSHPRLEDIFRISLAHGFSSKITGAGGGGYALILLPNDYSGMESFKKLCEDLEKEGFSFLETTVGGPGVVVEKLK